MRGSRNAVVARTGAFLLLTGLLSQIPTLTLLAAPADGVASVDPASATVAVPAPVPPPTQEQRLPVMDLSDVEGIWPADVTEVVPGAVDPGSPDQALADATPLPSEGAADVDAYAVTGTPSEHIALIHPDDVNHLTSSGAWRDIKLQLSPDGKGWSWTDPTGTVTTFPASVGSASPVTIATSSGTLSIAPSAGQAPGAATSDTVTYSGAFTGADLAYVVTLGGVQERILLAAAPASSGTFTFTASTTGLSARSQRFRRPRRHRHVGGDDLGDPSRACRL